MDDGRMTQPKSAPTGGTVKAGYQRPLDFKHGRVDLTHGSGGRAMAQLIEQLFAAAFDNPVLAQKNDMAIFTLPPGRVVMATDSHVVSPLFFPGGDIGCLSVHGTVNDVAMSGARADLPGRELHPGRGLSAGGSQAHRRLDGGGRARGERGDRHR
jgi:hypothetical protein